MKRRSFLAGVVPVAVGVGAGAVRPPLKNGDAVMVQIESRTEFSNGRVEQNKYSAMARYCNPPFPCESGVQIPWDGDEGHFLISDEDLRGRNAKVVDWKPLPSF